MSSVALTTMTPTALGRMCRKMIRRSRAPDTRAASTNSRSRSVRNSPRTRRAIVVQAKMPITTPSTAAPRLPNVLPSTAPITISGIVMMTSVKRMSTESVGLAVVAGDRADHDADDGRDHTGDDHDHERLLRAAHDDGEDVAADLVLTERVLADLRGEQAQRGDAVVDLLGDLVPAVRPPSGDPQTPQVDADRGEGEDDDEGEHDHGDERAAVTEEPATDDLALAEALGLLLLDGDLGDGGVGVERRGLE